MWVFYLRLKKHGCMFLRPSWPMIIISFSPSTGGRQPFSLWYNWSVLSISQTSSLMFNCPSLSQPNRCSQLSSPPTSWNQPRSWCLRHSPPRQLPSSSDHQAGVQGELAACKKSNLYLHSSIPPISQSISPTFRWVTGKMQSWATTLLQATGPQTSSDIHHTTLSS